MLSRLIIAALAVVALVSAAPTPPQAIASRDDTNTHVPVKVVNDDVVSTGNLLCGHWHVEMTASGLVDPVCGDWRRPKAGEEASATVTFRQVQLESRKCHGWHVEVNDDVVQPICGEFDDDEQVQAGTSLSTGVRRRRSNAVDGDGAADGRVNGDDVIDEIIDIGMNAVDSSYWEAFVRKLAGSWEGDSERLQENHFIEMMTLIEDLYYDNQGPAPQFSQDDFEPFKQDVVHWFLESTSSVDYAQNEPGQSGETIPAVRKAYPNAQTDAEAILWQYADGSIQDGFSSLNEREKEHDWFSVREWLEFRRLELGVEAKYPWNGYEDFKRDPASFVSNQLDEIRGEGFVEAAASLIFAAGLVDDST